MSELKKSDCFVFFVTCIVIFHILCNYTRRCQMVILVNT